MRRSVFTFSAMLGLVLAGSLPAELRLPVPPSEPPLERPGPALPAPAMAQLAGPAEYARMLRHCLDFEWKQAESVALLYPDLVDGRDRTDYVRGLLYRMRTQRVTNLQDLATGTAECSHCAGVSLHNLMLFFRHQGTPGWRKLGMPTRLLYERGLRLAPGDISLSIVRAGLLHDLGQGGEGDRLFRPPPPRLADNLTTHDIVNMAYYAAARGNRELLWIWLKAAMDRDPERTREWAGETDDLDAYRHEPVVMALLGRS